MNVRIFNSKIILMAVFLLLIFSLYNTVHADQISNYVLSEGSKEKTRLDLQNELLKNKLIDAFETAESIKNLKGSTIVDFGCGVSSAYPVIKEFIGNSGKYIGIDSSKNQIITAKQRFPNAHYIQGDEKKLEVLQKISSADIVFMRFVIMHQEKQKDFIQHIYSHMKSGSILIIQEPEDTTEGKKKMLNQYPYAEILCDFKAKLGKGLDLDYNFARNLKPILESFDPKKIIYKNEDVYITTLQARTFLRKIIENVAEKALTKGIYTKDYINQYMEAVSKLPSDDKHYWLLGSFHTFVLLK